MFAPHVCLGSPDAPEALEAPVQAFPTTHHRLVILPVRSSSAGASDALISFLALSKDLPAAHAMISPLPARPQYPPRPHPLHRTSPACHSAHAHPSAAATPEKKNPLINTDANASAERGVWASTHPKKAIMWQRATPCGTSHAPWSQACVNLLE